MSDQNQDPFRRSTRLNRSPVMPQGPQVQDDSTVLDPNASSCPLCNKKDTLQMAKCVKCNEWYHFKCVGINASQASNNWNCQECESQVNPKNTNCQVCDKEDAVMKIECTDCKNQLHYVCASVDVSEDTTTYKCRNCTTKSAGTESRSVRSSTSSKRRSVLQLEKLSKEKAIQDKLIAEQEKLIAEKAKLAQRQAEVDSDFLQKEYEIRDNMTDSEDDGAIGGETASKTEFISEWLSTSNKTDPIPNLDLILSLGATKEQILQSALSQLASGGTPNIDDMVLIPPKQVQFAQPLSNEESYKPNEGATVTGEESNMNLNKPSMKSIISHQPMGSDATLNLSGRPPNLKSLINQYERLNTSTMINVTSSSVQSSNNTMGPSNQTGLRSEIGPANSIPPQPITKNKNHQPSIPSTTPFTQTQSSIPHTPVQQSTDLFVSSPTSVPYTVQTSFYQQMNRHDDMDSQMLGGHDSARQGSSTPIPNQPLGSNDVHQQPLSYPEPLVSISDTQHQYVPTSSFQNQYVPASSFQHQYVITSSFQNQPPLGTLTSQQQSIPVSVYQQPVVSPIVSTPFLPPGIVTNQQQSMLNPNHQSMYGNNFFGLNNNGPGQAPLTLTNQWLEYDPQLNPNQVPPTRLQLASRQTMPKDYPKFNGDPGKWSVFINSYVNGTKTCGLSNSENLSRLEKCLEEPARKAVRNLLTRPDAVPEIIETLKMLYGRPEASIEAQLKAIREETAPKMEKMETFIDFSMSIRNVTSEIQKSGMWQYLWHPQLMQELINKLPYQMRLEWGQIKMTTPNANLVTFSEWLFSRARTACAVTLPTNTEKKSTSNSHVNAHSKSNNSNKNGSSESSNTKSCNACNGRSHEIYECRKFLGMSLNDRWETVKSNKICRICLGRHHILRCESKSLCGESGCTVKHHKLLHNPTKLPQTTAATTSQPTKEIVHHSAHQQNKNLILRRYIPVTLYGPKGSLNVIAFLDEGSDMTLVEYQVAQKLGLSGTSTDLFLEWTAKIVRKEPHSKSVILKISGTQTPHKQYTITGARTVRSLDLPRQTVNIDQLKDSFKFLRRLPIENYTDKTPGILIGLMDCRLSTPLKTKSGKWCEPIAAKTLLGWEVHGANSQSANIARINFHAENERNDDDKLHQMVAQFFSLENFGVKKLEQTVEAASDKRAKQLLESTTKRIGNKFETGLLWKNDDVRLPDSFPMAKRRLLLLEKRLQKDPDLATKFQIKLNEYIAKGYVRKLENEDETNERTWYLPLFPVTNDKKPGKIRLVWDAAAKVSNVSLNSMLLSGPDLLVPLQGVLYRFREGAFVVTGDIREMFHQILIRKEDQTSQRFLWREENSSEIDVYVLQVMSFGATCSPSSAQYVKNYNALQFVDQFPKAEKAIRTNTYVDDWLQAFDTEAEAEIIANEVKNIYARGGFEIRNWLSNSRQVSRNLGASSDDEQALCIGGNENQTERILGMWWHVHQDTFTYSLRFNTSSKQILLNNRTPTKREALRTLMSIYDPLGFLAAYLVHLKMILQDMWRIGIGWDQRIEENDADGLCDRWRNWIKLLPEIENIKIDRHYSSKIYAENPTRIELHVFVDAGELAYATVAYFRIEDEASVDCSLIGGKTKVAPLKPLSVPRMELQAAVLGARYKNSILENHTLKVVRTIIWSDSSTVLSWLRSDLRKYNQFVGARVGEILETTTLPEWRWIPSKLNLADDATKWKGSFNLDMGSRWFKGPDFLLQPEEFWPKQKITEETQEELRPKYLNLHTKHEVEPLSIKFEEIQKWKRTMAFVIRYVNNVKARLHKPTYTIRTGPLEREELQDGENALYRMAQWDEFAPEIRRLRNEINSNGRRTSVEKTSLLYRYSPYLDYAGVLRMRGRIDAASNVSIDQKRPIILPNSHFITELVVKEYHVHYKHQNTETVINEINQKFVIPRLRALVKRIRRTCQHCKNASAQPKPPEMAQLPVGRLASFTRPFTYVGVDYAGPYKITQFRRSVKRWIVVFTCLTIRGVYIDLVESLATDSCIMAINRFIARNGRPQEFFSDRGTCFVGLDNELAKEIAKIDHESLKTKFTTCYTKWNFNPPYGQHMGGAWERLIGSMKTTLDKILPKSHYPNHETLVTALTEVENIINSRPLTFVSVEPDDQEALTPNHFLKGSSNGNKPPGIFPSPPATLRGNWRYAQQIANEFWHKWVKEYLPMITRRTKWFEDVKPIEVGDQIIIVDENSPRNMWDRGVVVEAVKSGPDGRISRASVRTTDGIYTRPVSKLAVLDLKKPEAKDLTGEILAEGSVTASSDIQVAMTDSSNVSATGPNQTSS